MVSFNGGTDCTLGRPVDEKGFYKRFVMAQADPINHLIELQLQSDREIFLVPLLMSFGKKPFRSIPTLMDILIFDSTTHSG